MCFHWISSRTSTGGIILNIYIGATISSNFLIDSPPVLDNVARTRGQWARSLVSILNPYFQIVFRDNDVLRALPPKLPEVTASIDNRRKAFGATTTMANRNHRNKGSAGKVVSTEPNPITRPFSRIKMLPFVILKKRYRTRDISRRKEYLISTRDDVRTKQKDICMEYISTCNIYALDVHTEKIELRQLYLCKTSIVCCWRLT